MKSSKAVRSVYALCLGAVVITAIYLNSTQPRWRTVRAFEPGDAETALRLSQDACGTSQAQSCKDVLVLWENAVQLCQDRCDIVQFEADVRGFIFRPLVHQFRFGLSFGTTWVHTTPEPLRGKKFRTSTLNRAIDFGIRAEHSR